LELFPKEAQYYFCKPNVPRGLDASKLAQVFKSNGFKGLVYPSVKAALNAAKQNACQEDLIYIGGSTFVVAEII
jgi:dihydrofolate synthase/folylpolyglutamate synthase